MLRPTPISLGTALLVPALALTPARTAAQESDVMPRVWAVEYEGVQGLDVNVLEQGIVTQPTRCRGLILKPLCWVSGSSLFWAEHELDREELERDELRLRVTYFRKGYREAQVESTVAPEGDGVRVTFSVTEGPLTTVGSLPVTQTNPLLAPEQIAEARLPAEGGPLDLIRLDSAKLFMRNWLWDQGHADAQVESVATPDTLAHVAALEVRVDPGPRTTIGEVVVEGNEGVSQRTILRLFDLQPGALYRRTDMTSAQRRLYETELFRQSLVTVPPTPDSAKKVVIIVQEAPPRHLRVGPGFNTVEFFQGEVRFTRHNVFGGARRLDTRAAVGNILAPQLYGTSIFGSGVPEGVGREVEDAYLSPIWQVGVDLTQPFFFSSRTSLGVGVSAHRRSIPGIVVDRGVAGNLAITRRLADRTTASVTYRFERTHVDAEEVYFCVSFGVCDPVTIETLRRPHRMSPLAFLARADRTDDPLGPTQGWIGRLDLELASAQTLSDFRYFRVGSEASRYFRLGQAVLAGRIRAGWVRPLESTSDAFELPEDELAILHPRRRFFAGGARSVRGYGENQLGPMVLTVPTAELITPSDTAGVTACTYASVADASCDPNVAPSSAFRLRPLGGNTLFEASLEYRFPLTATFTAAAFVDAGIVHGQRINFPPGDRSAVTPGVGVRYLSPIGPVRVDLGLRPSLAEDLPVVTQLEGEDGERRLARLETLKHYDPREDAKGALGGFFSRLQLHLAIGEAF